MSQFPKPYQVEMVKATYPDGTRIKMVSMSNDPDPIQKGECGTVVCVDDMGTLLMEWDNGRTLGVCVLDGDQVVKIPNA